MSAAGAVRVAVRVRPMNSREHKMNAKLIVDMKGQQTTLSNPHATGQEDIKKFTFDHSYWSYDRDDSHYATQDQVFDDLGGDVLQAAFDGYNACVFAYGQTGSGKSYTMMGYGEDIGLIPRICEALFDRCTQQSDSDTKFSVEVSYLEIYNEKVKDLLVDPKISEKKSLKVREHPKTGPFVDGLSSHEVKDFDAIAALMEQGNSNRTVAATGMNDTSSRSHAVFTVIFKQASFVAGVPSEKTSKINLVDLAGSERTSATGATGIRLKEGGNINKSLTTLGLCISALAERTGASSKKKQGSFIPYRDSVLTWLLKDSLGGNSKTIMVAAISPADVNYGETLSTLHYANRAKNIINKPTVNEDENVRLIRELRAEVDRLKGLLGGDEEIQRLEQERADAQAALTAATTDEEKAEAQEKLNQADSALSVAKNADANELKAKIEQSEQMMQVMMGDWKNKFDSMTQILDSRGMSLNQSGRAVSVESKQPHFVSLNLDDPLSTGIVLYYLHEGSNTIGSGGDEVDIPLPGAAADILPVHCAVEYDGEEHVMLHIGEDDNGQKALVTVNGVQVDEVVELHQGFTVTLGQSTMFRFNHPVEVERLRSGKGTLPADAKSLGQLLSDKMRQDDEELRQVRERLEMIERERAEAEAAEVERQRQIEELEELRRQEEEVRQKESEERMNALRDQIKNMELEREKAETNRAEEQRLLDEERNKMLQLEEQLVSERERKESFLRQAREEAERKAEERAAEEARKLEEKQKETEAQLRRMQEDHERRRREIEAAETKAAAEAAAFEENVRRLQAEEEHAKQRRVHEEAELRRREEENSRLLQQKEQDLMKMQRQLQAKGSSQMQFTDVWEIRIPEYKLRVEHYVYKVEVCLLGQRWFVWRRFSHFEDLHKMLKAKMRGIMQYIAFPSKHVGHSMMSKIRRVGTTDERFLAQRAQELETYLNEVIQKTYKLPGSPFFEVDRSILERNFAFFRHGSFRN